MDEEERQKKITAGKNMLADFKKRKMSKSKNSQKQSSVQSESNMKQKLMTTVKENSSHLEENATQNVQLENLLKEHKITENSDVMNNKRERCSVDDYENMLAEYSKKIQKFQHAINQRDVIISQLSERLSATLQKENVVHLNKLVEEVNTLQCQLQQAQEVLAKQNSKDGISAHELLEAKNQIILLQQQSDHKGYLINEIGQKLCETKQELINLNQHYHIELEELKEKVTDYSSKILEIQSNLSEQVNYNEELKLEYNKLLNDYEFKDTELTNYLTHNKKEAEEKNEHIVNIERKYHAELQLKQNEIEILKRTISEASQVYNSSKICENVKESMTQTLWEESMENQSRVDFNQVASTGEVDSGICQKQDSSDRGDAPDQLNLGKNEEISKEEENSKSAPDHKDDIADLKRRILMKHAAEMHLREFVNSCINASLAKLCDDLRTSSKHTFNSIETKYPEFSPHIKDFVSILSKEIIQMQMTCAENAEKAWEQESVQIVRQFFTYFDSLLSRNFFEDLNTEKFDDGKLKKLDTIYNSTEISELNNDNMKHQLSSVSNELNKCLMEKSKMEIDFHNHLEDLVDQHQQELKSLEIKLRKEVSDHLEEEYSSYIDNIKRTHEEQIENILLEQDVKFQKQRESFEIEQNKLLEELKDNYKQDCELLQAEIESCNKNTLELKGKCKHGEDVIINDYHNRLKDFRYNFALAVDKEKKFILCKVDEHVGSKLELNFLQTLEKMLANITQEFENGICEITNAREHELLSYDIPTLTKMHEASIEKEEIQAKSLKRKSSDKSSSSEGSQNHDLWEKKENLEDDGSQNSSKLECTSESHAAETNFHLLHVLSDLVKTFLDIEQDIQQHLVQLGLTDQHTESSLFDDDESQNFGSKEDFASLSIGDSPNLDLTEDGPDLTPRAWDFITSCVNSQDMDPEGKDVVLCVSRRLRLAVDHILHLLTTIMLAQKSQDFCVLLKRNEELSNEVQKLNELKSSLELELSRTDSIIQNSKIEKQNYEETIGNLLESKNHLNKEIESLNSKLQKLQNSQIGTLKEHHFVALGLGQEQISKNKGSALSTDSSNMDANKDDDKLYGNSMQPHQQLLSRIHQLEILVEELTSEKEILLEEKQKEAEDFKFQIDAMEKQLQSNKKFIEEQILEHEQERDEYLQVVDKLKELVKEKEHVQIMEERLTQEVKRLEKQLKGKIEDSNIIINKKDELENELLCASEKIHDLQDVIKELEKQLDHKISSENELNAKVAALEESLLLYEKNNAETRSRTAEDLEHLKNVSSNVDASDRLRDLEDKLESRTQEVEELSQNQTLLQELRGQIHFLEAKVDNKVRYLEAFNLSSVCASPVPSEEASYSESQDGEKYFLSVEDGWEMSPRSLNWLEIRRLEEKVTRLTQIDEELMKKNKEIEIQFKKAKQLEDELQNEKEILQQQTTEQLLQISALKSQLEQERSSLKRNVNVSNIEMMTELIELRESANEAHEFKGFVEEKLRHNEILITELEDELNRKNQQTTALQRQLEEKETTLQQSSSVRSHSPLPEFMQMLLKEKNEEIDLLNEQLNQFHLKKQEINCVDTTIQTDLIKVHHKSTLTDIKTDSSKKEKKELKVTAVNTSFEFDKLNANVKQMHHAEMDELNQIWQQRLVKEIGNLEETLLQQYTNIKKQMEDQFNIEKLELMGKHKKELDHLHKQLQQSNEMQLKQISKQVEEITAELQMNHQSEVNELKSSLEKAISKTKSLITTHEKEISSIREVFDKELESQKKNMQSLYEKEVHQIETILIRKYESDKENLEQKFQNNAAHIRDSIVSELDEEIAYLVSMSEEEIKSLRLLIHTYWKQEMEKMHDHHFKEILNKFKLNIDEEASSYLLKLFEQKLKDIQTTFEKHICHETSHVQNTHIDELRNIRSTVEKLINFSNSERKIGSEEKLIEQVQGIKEKFLKKWEYERKRLQVLHHDEISSLKLNAQKKLESQQQILEEMHESKLNQIELKYKEEIENLKALLDLYKSETSKENGGIFENSINNDRFSVDSTSCSDATSSSRLSNSIRSQQELLFPHIQKLLDKIHREGLEGQTLAKLIDEIVQELLKLRSSRHKYELEVERLHTEKDDLEEQLANCKKLLEFYAQQGAGLAHSLQVSLESDKSQYQQLQAKLVEQKSAYLDLEKVLSSAQSEILHLKQVCQYDKYPSFPEVDSNSDSVHTEIEKLRSGDVSGSLLNSLPLVSLNVQMESSLQSDDDLKFVSKENIVPSVLSVDNNKLCNGEIKTGSASTIGDTGDLETKLHYLYWKYKRAESYRKALTFQKNFFITHLAGFEESEKATLALLGHINKENCSRESNDFCFGNSQQNSGLSHFRSAVYAVIAVHRMKFLVCQWRNSANVPPPYIIAQEVNSIMKKMTYYLKSKTHRSFKKNKVVELCKSGGSLPGTITGQNYGCTATSSRAASSQSRRMSADTLSEYVTRLKNLHAKLGL